MELLELGQIVFSKRGRDRGTAYVVVGTFVESGKQYAYLADGNKRRAEKPKKKKSAHIQPTKTIVSLETSPDVGALNAQLRKVIAGY